ncbi:uncharacterized protein FOMMEDRAFT_17604 [Fomitiporia mediterranea MF3/22]|uniref:uncharacterized protein n=1 Tax=Fomitiporia mediterranea (strain MF3/22) TaxID=694068 RepID=UPI0004408631|nr:uncharacterized protein FOMMEDRAFT_17604 [Fomitiporia mediterranea MF3/22]EJD07127.1 hypothetical protein FOMMEDRAFT_17604 [Fomitiporia mediterranea MF3/22]
MTALPFSLLAAVTAVSASAVVLSRSDSTATQNLAPRQSGISALQCTLMLEPVQCCQEVELFSVVSGLIGPILSDLGIPLPGLSTVVAFDCQPTLLGLGCSEDTLCCSLVVPNQDIGINCQPVQPILRS